jgi:P27 family predicted phage terminase small subunit
MSIYSFNNTRPKGQKEAESLMNIEDQQQMTPEQKAMLQPPAYLGRVAAAEWRRLIKIGVFAPTDKTLLIAYCESFENFRKAQQDVKTNGITIKVPVVSRDGIARGFKLLKNPACTVMDAERKALMQIGRMLKLHAEAPEEEDEFGHGL